MNDIGNPALWIKKAYRVWNFIALACLGFGIILKMFLLPRPMDIGGILRWVLSALSGGIAICLYIIAALGTLSISNMFYLSTRLNGFPSLSTCQALLKVRSISITTSGSHFPFRSWRHPLWFLTLSLLLFAVWALIKVEIFLGLSLVILADLSWGLLNDVTPPTVLLLASSSLEAVILQATSLEAMPGYRIISLLDLAVMPRTATEKVLWASHSDRQNAQSFVGGDILRLARGYPWEITVRALMEVVPIIAVDTRVCSNGVVSEIQWICSAAPLSNKTVFITGENGDHPALDVVETEHGCIGADEIRKLIRPGEFFCLLETVAKSKNAAVFFDELIRIKGACRSGSVSGLQISDA